VYWFVSSYLQSACGCSVFIDNNVSCRVDVLCLLRAISLPFQPRLTCNKCSMVTPLSSLAEPLHGAVNFV
jgi:hypothetical protein